MDFMRIFNMNHQHKQPIIVFHLGLYGNIVCFPLADNFKLIKTCS